MISITNDKEYKFFQRKKQEQKRKKSYKKKKRQLCKFKFYTRNLIN